AISTSVVFHEPGAGWYFGGGRLGTSRTARMAVIFSLLFSSRNGSGSGLGKSARADRARARRAAKRIAQPPAAPTERKVRRSIGESPGRYARFFVGRPQAISPRYGATWRWSRSWSAGPGQPESLTDLGPVAGVIRPSRHR